MSVSMALVSCDKEKEANPTIKESSLGSALRTDVDAMPSDFVAMEIPAEFTSSPEYQGEYESFVETAIIETQSGPVSIEYYIKGDFDGKLVAFAFNPEDFATLGTNQDFFTTEQGVQVLTTASEKGLFTCLKACGGKKDGCGADCWGQFAKDIVIAFW